MKLTRAKLNLGVIQRMGSDSQKLAHKQVQGDKESISLFKEAVGKLNVEFTDEVVNHVRVAVANFAFHARSEVEWRKFRANTTDRTKGKEKKKTLRETLKQIV